MKHRPHLPGFLLSCLPLLALLLAACSGSSADGNPSLRTRTTLIKAAFLGSTPSDPTPDPGERLILHFNGQVVLAAGSILDASDLTLSSGSLGSPILAPSLLSGTSVEIVLGTGVSFTPGTTTVQLSSAQDAVSDSAGIAVPGSSALTILATDTVAPTISALTLDSVPVDLNGTGQAGGTMQVSENGFTIDASYSDASSIDPTSVVLRASVPVGVQVVVKAASRGTAFSKFGKILKRGDLVPGTNLLPYLGGTPTATGMSLTVPSDMRFPVGSMTLTLSVLDTTGMLSATKSFSFRVKAQTEHLRPFEAGQVWYLDLARDIESISSSTTDSGVTIDLSAVSGANGTPDFHEILSVYGLRTATPIAAVSGAKDSNEVVLDLLKARILAQLVSLYPGVNVSFTYTKPGAFPEAARVPYKDAAFSQIAIAARSDLSGTLGLAYFDPHNAFQDDDTLVPPSSTSRLGVFPYTLADGGTINTPGSYFRTVFDPLLDHRGTPVGEDAGDAARLQNLLAGNSGGDLREQWIGIAINSFGRVLAVITAHECAHSLGLVQDGKQPDGLYGNDAFFTNSTSGHIDLSSTVIFSSTAQEVMAPGISFKKADNPATAFNALLLGYLKETVVYDKD